MPTVTVEADDLQLLLLATGHLKKIEESSMAIVSMLQNQKHDPFVEARAGEFERDKFQQVHDRIAKAWRNVLRADAPVVVGEPTEADLRLIAVIAHQGGKLGVALRPGDQARPQARTQWVRDAYPDKPELHEVLDGRDYRSLVSKGLAEFGHEFTRVNWSTSGTETYGDQGLRIRLTAAGWKYAPQFEGGYHQVDMGPSSS